MSTIDDKIAVFAQRRKALQGLVTQRAKYVDDRQHCTSMIAQVDIQIQEMRAQVMTARADLSTELDKSTS